MEIKSHSGKEGVSSELGNSMKSLRAHVVDRKWRRRVWSDKTAQTKASVPSVDSEKRVGLK